MKVWRKDEFLENDRDGWVPPGVKSVLYPERPPMPVQDPQVAAKLYADHCHSQRDGWEWSWPIEFIVFDGHLYFTVEVERQVVPEFWAGRPEGFTPPFDPNGPPNE